MNIIFIRSNPVAPDPRLEKTVNSLLGLGHKVKVLAWDRNNKYRCEKSVLQLEHGKADLIRFGIPGIFGGGFSTNALSILKFQKRIIFWLLINRKSYDAVHAYDFDTGYAALKCTKLLKKKLIYDIADYYVDTHGLSGTKIGQLVRKAEGRIINSADAVIICTEKRKQQIKGTSPRNLTIIHNSPARTGVELKKGAVDASSFDSQAALKIVYVGILMDGRFIKELADIVSSGSGCEFHVGGFGQYENYFEEMAQKHRNIFYYGRIPYARTLELEQNCDVLAAIYDPSIPNHNYAAPNKFYEALMLGKPLIMVKNTGMDDIVTKYGIGEVIDFNRESLEMAVEKLISRKAEWKRISEVSKKIYNEEFSWEMMEERLKQLYENIICSTELSNGRDTKSANQYYQGI